MRLACPLTWSKAALTLSPRGLLPNLTKSLDFPFTDSVSDSAVEEDELVWGSRQLDCAVREVKMKEARQ